MDEVERLREAIRGAIDGLTSYLLDNTAVVFEEIPDLDGIRMNLQEAIGE